MKSLRIAVDVDDVLAEHAAGFIEFSNKQWGTNLTVDDYDEHWTKMWQIDNLELERRSKEFHDSAIIRAYGHIGGASDALRSIAQNHQLMIATSRRLQMQGDTIAWIEEHFPGIFTSEEVYFAGIWDKEITEHSIQGTKADLINQIEADVLVDDQLKHCLAVAESGRRAILFGDYSWNKADKLPNRVTRCLNWNEVELEIKRIANA